MPATPKQLTALPADATRMIIELEPWGGIAVSWQGRRLVLLVDTLGAWVAWDGLLVRKVAVGRA